MHLLGKKPNQSADPMESPVPQLDAHLQQKVTTRCGNAHRNNCDRSAESHDRPRFKRAPSPNLIFLGQACNQKYLSKEYTPHTPLPLPRLEQRSCVCGQRRRRTLSLILMTLCCYQRRFRTWLSGQEPHSAQFCFRGPRQNGPRLEGEVTTPTKETGRVTLPTLTLAQPSVNHLYQYIEFLCYNQAETAREISSYFLYADVACF